MRHLILELLGERRERALGWVCSPLAARAAEPLFPLLLWSVLRVAGTFPGCVVLFLENCVVYFLADTFHFSTREFISLFSQGFGLFWSSAVRQAAVLEEVGGRP